MFCSIVVDIEPSPFLIRIHDAYPKHDSSSPETKILFNRLQFKVDKYRSISFFLHNRLSNLELAFEFVCLFIIREGAFYSNKVENLLASTVVLWLMCPPTNLVFPIMLRISGL